MNQQYKFIVGISVIVATVGFLVFTAVDQTKMYMVTVAEYLAAQPSYAGETVRIAGRVADGSVQWNAETRQLNFDIQDMNDGRTLPVRYSGLLPDMFAEGRDVVVEGPSQGGDAFMADNVLTSCPSKYSAQDAAGGDDAQTATP
jgi:cytochrome c-type biogenesis protein CcmE